MLVPDDAAFGEVFTDIARGPVFGAALGRKSRLRPCLKGLKATLSSVVIIAKGVEIPAPRFTGRLDPVVFYTG